MIKTASKEPLYKTKFSNGKISAFADVPVEKGGAGDGFMPYELLEAALATCINVVIRMYAQNHAIDLASVSTTVTLDLSKDDETCLKYSIDLPADLSPTDRKKLLAAAGACPVHKMLENKLTFSFSE